MLWQCRCATVRELSAHRLKWEGGKPAVSPRVYSALAFRLKGSGHFFCGGRELLAQEGDLLFLRQGCAYSVDYTPGEIYVLHFQLSGYDGNLEGFRPGSPEVFERLFRSAAEEWVRQEPGCEFRLFAAYYQILAEICRQESQMTAAGSPAFRHAVQLLEDRFRSPDLQLPNICAEAGISVSYFRRCFEERYRKPPVQHLNELRMHYAEQLLAARSGSIQQIALACGFHDEKYFSRVFKSYYGTPPSARFQL